MTAFTAGIVLLLSIWGAKRPGLSTDSKREMAEVHKCMQILKLSETRWHGAGRLWCVISKLNRDCLNILLDRDILYNLASMGELPLPQRSPPSGTKRERESDVPLSAGAGGSPSNLLFQNEIPRTIAGSRRVTKESPFIRPTERTPLHKRSPQRSQCEPLSSPERLFSFNTRPPQLHAQPSHGQIRESPEPGQTISATPPFTNAAPMFALPVYSNELGSAPLDGEVTFSAHAHLSQPQVHPPQPDLQTNYWYTMPSNTRPQDSERSESASHAGPSGGSSSHRLHYPPAPTPQHQPHSRRYHPTRGVPLGDFSSTSEMNSLTGGPYGMDTADVGAGSIFDPMTTAYTQRQETSAYALGPTVPEMGSSSVVSPSPRSSSGSSMENTYSGMAMDTMPNLSEGQYQHQHQHQRVPQQHEQQSLSHPFTDAGAIWSNVPTGFEYVKFVLF